jgi:hypothetical protein
MLKNELRPGGSSIVQPQDTSHLGCEAMPSESFKDLFDVCP